MPSKPSAKKTKHKIGKQCINELEISGDIGPTLMGVFRAKQVHVIIWFDSSCCCHDELKYAWKKTCPQLDAHLEIRLLSAQILLNRIHDRSDANQHQTDANQQTKKRKMCERDVVPGSVTVLPRFG